MTRSLVQTQFGTNAAAYATSAVHASGESLAMLVEMASPQAGWTGLDVATGAGHTALAFAPHVARMIASDITEEMLAETRALAAARGLGNVATAVAAADRLPFADESLDLVTCRLAAHHFPDPAAFVSEAARVLKRGGILALVDNVSPDGEILSGLDRAALRNAVVVYNQFEKLRDPSHGRALTVAEWAEVIADAGLEITQRRVVAKAMEFGAWVRRMQCTPGTVARLSAMISEGTDADVAEAHGAAGHSTRDLVRFLMPRRDAEGLWISLRELVLVALKTGRAPAP